MTAAVYIVGGQRDHEELRYSLRSLANAPDITQVWIVGTVPDWVKGARTIRLDPTGEKFSNQRQSMTALVGTKGAPKSFYLFHEDHYVIEPVAGDLPVFHLGATSEFFRTSWRDRNTWFRAVKATTEWVSARTGNTDPVCYEAHTPLRYNRDLLRECLDAYPADRSVVAGPLYHLAGEGPEGTSVGNAKAKVADDLQTKLALPMPFLSSNQESFNGAVGAYLTELFPDPCRWEK